MTAAELSGLRHIRQEIEGLRKRLARYSAQCAQLSRTLADLPRGAPGADALAEAAAGAEACRMLLWRQLRVCMAAERRALQFIQRMPDSLVRLIFSARYLDDCSWREIALQAGGNNTEDSVRMLHNRYLQAHCTEEEPAG